MKQSDIAVILLNWNGETDSLVCLDALRLQTQQHKVIAVDNGSSDNFSKIIADKHTDVVLLQNERNLGFSGGVNTGIKYAIENKYKFIALINNDALPAPTWLEELASQIQKSSSTGIVTGKLLRTDGTIDSTGDQYTSWGLAYPRGRDETDEKQYEEVEPIFSASGGASLYRAAVFEDIGIFDEDFFAYFEDVDVSFRAQLAGWKIVYAPRAIAHHKVGASSSKIPGFTTYMTIKNLPWLFWKNVPLRLVPVILPRFMLAYTSIILSSLAKKKFVPVCKGLSISLLYLPKKLLERRKIQKSSRVPYTYIKSLLTYDLPPNAHKLLRLRSVLRRVMFWRKR